MTIGTFSRASQLSVKALRAHHESGLLVPTRIDPATGYRRYHATQLTDAAVILRLRSLDVPLVRVREVVHARDPEVTRRVLAAHAAAMEERLADVSRIVDELQAGVALPAAHTPVHVRDVPAAHTLAVRGEVTATDVAAFLETAFAELAAALDRSSTAPIGPFGALYASELADDGPEAVDAFVPIGAPVALPEDRGRVRLGELATARVAVLVHAGSYDEIADSYRHLGAWVALNDRSAGERVRETYLIGPGDVDDPAGFRTEIHWPLAARPHDSPGIDTDSSDTPDTDSSDTDSPEEITP